MTIYSISQYFWNLFTFHSLSATTLSSVYLHVSLGDMQHCPTCLPVSSHAFLQSAPHSAFYKTFIWSSQIPTEITHVILCQEYSSVPLSSTNTYSLSPKLDATSLTESSQISLIFSILIFKMMLSSMIHSWWKLMIMNVTHWVLSI